MVPTIESVTFLPCRPLYYIQVQKKVSLICSPLQSQAEAHYKGSKHAKKVKALEATKNKPKVGSSKDSAKVNTGCSTTPVTANISDKSGQ